MENYCTINTLSAVGTGPNACVLEMTREGDYIIMATDYGKQQPRPLIT